MSRNKNALNVNVNVSAMAYALYKQNWINQHTDSALRIDTLRKYYEFLLNNSHISFEDYLQQFGYNGYIYASYENFYKKKYRDEKYISQLLDIPELVALYHEDLNKDYNKNIVNDNDEMEL